MDDADNKSYPANSYGLNYQNLPGDNIRRPQNVASRYPDEDEDEDENDYDDMDEDEGADNGDEEDDDDDDDDDDGRGVQRIGKDGYKLGNYNDAVDADDDFDDMQNHPKKRRLKTLLSDYVFAPRASAPSSSATFQKPPHGGREPSADWTEHETSILLNTWGERFLKQGRKSLHSEEWQEVAEKVSQESNMERTDTQCRNRLDTLKTKYKKEKTKPFSKWMHFPQMDNLLSATQQQPALPCGVDAGEFIFMNPKVYLDRSNAVDEMRDSPENSESAEGGEDDMEDIISPAKKAASFKILADSIYKLNEVYQKVENSKRQQILELEKMRMNFHRDLELQKRQILDRAQAEIQKIRGGGEYDVVQDDDDDDDVSGENDSG